MTATMTDSMANLPSLRTHRPAYLENVIRSRAPSLSGSLGSADSGSSQLSSPTDMQPDIGTRFGASRALSPTWEEDPDDRISIRSFALSFSWKPQWRLPHKLHHRTVSSISRSSTPDVSATSRRDSGRFPRNLSISTIYGKGSAALRRKEKTSAMSGPPQVLSCQRCYYSIARNCNGWVFGGNHGDACESCLVRATLPDSHHCSC